MKAPTVMEVFIEQEQVRVELEIGFEDLKAFSNLLPDELMEILNLDGPPLPERLPKLFLEDLTIRLDDGAPLRGFVQSMTGRKRLLRDEITGEPLPGTGTEEDVLVATLIYPFEGRPEKFAIKPPQAGPDQPLASIGFATYHLGLPIMDFRYLGREETAQLDWDDPWYSRFTNRNLWRQYDAPINAFLYVEPFEVRVEIIVRPLDLQQWVDLGLQSASSIPVAAQEQLEQKVANFLADRIDLTVDGERVTPALDRIHFLRRTLRTSTVIEPREELDVHSATLGAIYVANTAGLPQTATLTWGLFSEKYPVVRAAATDEAGPMPYLLRPEDNQLEWRNYLKTPSIPALAAVASPPPPGLPMWRLLGWGMLVASGIGALIVVARFISRRRLTAVSLTFTGVLLAVSISVLFVTRGSVPNTQTTAELMTALLRNVYLAFDFRKEEVVYDTLEQSVSGELLTQVYLQTKKSLELASQGGARVKVRDVEMLSADPTPLRGEPGFMARCRWNVTGNVGHWGHVHQRTNQYDAEFTVKPIDGAWKIAAIRVVDQERLK